MVRFTALAILAGAAISAPAAAQYEVTAPTDSAAQLREMVSLYDELCLRAFPDDRGVARALDSRHAEPLSAEQVRRYLHEDPGRGWRLQGQSARFDITIEDPPFHSCSVRTVTASGFADLAPYTEIAERFERGGGFQRVPPVDTVLGDIRTSGRGEVRSLSDGHGEALLVYFNTPVEKVRELGQTGIEVRFVHTFSSAGH